MSYCVAVHHDLQQQPDFWSHWPDDSELDLRHTQYLDMLNDEARNDAYYEALVATVQAGVDSRRALWMLTVGCGTL